MTRQFTWARRMSLRTRFLLVAAPPLAVMLLVASLPLAQRWQEARGTARVAQFAALAASVGGLVHELQKERGVTGIVLGSHGAQFSAELAEQRRATAASQSSFLNQDRLIDAPEPALADKFAQVEGMLTQLAAVRVGVDALSLQPSESFTRFTELIRALLGLAPQIGFPTPDSTVSRSFLTLFNLMQAKERAGQERAVGAQGFAAGRFAPELYRRFLCLRMEQDTFLQMFDLYATGEARLSAISGLCRLCGGPEDILGGDEFEGAIER